MEPKFFNPWAETAVGANRLPHWDQPGATYFLTLRLADSLPFKLLTQWQEERHAWLTCNPPPWSFETEREYHERFSVKIERWLDEAHGECLLRRPEVRDKVSKVFARFDRDRYWHHALVLMPNHAHLLVTLKAGIGLPELLKAWKGTSSRAVGIALGRRMTDEAFWQKDYFDRLVRDAEHFWNCAGYIQRNPVKAKLRAGEYSLYVSDEMKGRWGEV